MEFRESLPEDLQPYEETFYAIVSDALKKYSAVFGDKRAAMSTRTERSLIHDHLVTESKRYFPDTFSENPFLIELGRYKIKPKKLDENLKSSNSPTQRVFNFLHQILSLFDKEPTINLQLGYQPHPIDLTKSLIWMTRPSGRTNEWAYDFRGISKIAPIPPPIEPSPVPISGRVAPKADPAIKPASGEKE